MQIQSLTSLHSANTHNYSKNFKGLWGKTSIESDMDEGLGCFVDRETFYYYPFKDESIRKINSVIKENTFDFIDESGVKPRYIIKECKQGITLPFKESYYKTYLELNKNSSNLFDFKKVHFLVQDKYVNKTRNEQTPARNEKLDGLFDRRA